MMKINEVSEATV